MHHSERWMVKTASIKRATTLNDLGEHVPVAATTVKCAVTTPRGLTRKVGSAEYTISTVFLVPAATAVAVGDRIAEGAAPTDTDYREVRHVRPNETHRGERAGWAVEV
jgi:hypothetical protein